jgi:predicted 3-demethylubiquinone-9 3-methyltransferase (glyoxalase superfamily)
MQKITPHLWFDKEAQEAAAFYASLIPGSAVTQISKISGTPSGDCDIVSFSLAGQPFMAISAGPAFKFNPSISFQLKCGTKAEVDDIWKKLVLQGKVLMPLDTYPFSERYGWLEDKYGLSWQIMIAGGEALSQRITPALLFVGNVCGRTEEAINFYTSVFLGFPDKTNSENTKAEVVARYPKDSGPDQEGSVQYSQFWLSGQEFAAMDSAREHKFAFNEAVSLMVPCDTQEEIDYFWRQLSADPKAEQCGWLKDKFGVSWQISAANVEDLLGSEDRSQVDRVTQAILKMKKLDLAGIKRAAAATNGS